VLGCAKPVPGNGEPGTGLKFNCHFLRFAPVQIGAHVKHALSRVVRSFVIGVLVGLAGLVIVRGAQPLPIRGALGIHDPSTVVKCNGRYYVFGTGQGIISRSSADLRYWEAGPSVFDRPPAWTTNAVPGFTGNFWAPDIVYVNGKYYLYFSVSTWGSQISAIGLATNPTLDPSDPSYQWTDQGPVIQSTNGMPYNCIDPSVFVDPDTGRMWMAFGSYWSGIYIVELDPSTGKRIAPDSPVTHVARHDYGVNSIEAACLFKRGAYYYLFVNWDSCCAGMNSTYNIRVGRSTSVTGPYRDRSGSGMSNGGGTLFLKTTGKYIGPGHTGIFEETGTNWFTFHYYDADANGAPTLGLAQLSWTEDGWPIFTNDWSAVYRFEADARDENGRYYGLLQNNPAIRLDPLMGTVLELNGLDQYVKLPNGAANGQTFVTVFKWNGGADWQRVLDFGRGTNTYAFITPRAGNGKLRFALATNGIASEQVLDGPTAAPTNAWTHVAVTMDGLRAILYVNGVSVATNSSMRGTVPDIAPTNVWLGRSQFAADPYFNGQLSSVRIYARPLSPSEITAPQPVIIAPRAGMRYRPGDTIAFGGYGLDYADVPLSVTGLVWTVEFHNAGSTNIVLGPLTGVDCGSFVIPTDGEQATNGFHRIVLVAADQLGRKSTNSVDIHPGESGADWVAFYPFDGNANDTNNMFNGTLMGGATTPTDPIRGPVLNLSGAGQYVSLPTGVGAMCTFAAWVKWNGGSAWQRIFDFGVDTAKYAFMTPRAGNGRLRFAITATGAGGERVIDAPSALPSYVWTHVAVVLDGQQAVLYLNGRAVAVNNSFYLLPSDIIGSANYIGRSHFGSDPYFGGQMDSVMIASTPLPVEQITTQPLSIELVGESVKLSWPAFETGFVLHAATNLGPGTVWLQLTNTPVTTNGIRVLTLPVTASAQFFRLTLP